MDRLFSRRTGEVTRVNRLTRAVARHRAAGEPLLDLTASNPTAFYPDVGRAALRALAVPGAALYEPDPQGMPAARQALAEDLARRREGACRPQPEDIFLSASTSEAYAWLFKLLCDPGDRVLVPAPGYPLFAHLAALEGVHADLYPLEFHQRWALDVTALEARLQPRTRAIVIITPHNPTGWMLNQEEAGRLHDVARRHRLVLISDEVFADFGRGGSDDGDNGMVPAPAPCLALAGRHGRTVSLGGLSKEAGLPQMKVGWLLLGGEAAWRRQAASRLQMIADTCLSVATPQQHALGRWLEAAGSYRKDLRRRLEEHRGALAQVMNPPHRGQLMPSEGGWSAVLRLPATREDEEDALALLQEEGVLIHPGYYYDFPAGTYLVLSLLPAPDDFRAAMKHLAAYLDRRSAGL